MPHISKRADLAADLFVGISDGLLISLAVTTGLGVAFSSFTVIIAGLSVVFFTAVAMALSRYLSSRSEADDHRLHHIVSSLGLPTNEKEEIFQEAEKTKTEWQAIVHEVSDPSATVRSAWVIGVSHMAAGLIPVLPFFVVSDPRKCLAVSVSISLLSLFVFGYAKGRLTDQTAIAVALRMTFAGLLAATAAYGVARVFL